MNARNHLGFVGGAALALAVGAGIWLGSHGLRHFDPAVIGYAIGTLLAAFAVGLPLRDDGPNARRHECISAAACNCCFSG